VNGTVTVRALATLAAFAPPSGTMPLAPGDTAETVAKRLGLDWSAVGTALRNGRPADRDTPLAAGDILSFVPPISGG
jgi:molybdopterin converting factor small subunit